MSFGFSGGSGREFSTPQPAAAIFSTVTPCRPDCGTRLLQTSRIRARGTVNPTYGTQVVPGRVNWYTHIKLFLTFLGFPLLRNTPMLNIDNYLIMLGFFVHLSSCMKEFYKEMLDETDFITDRQRELKKNAGLDPKDRRVSWWKNSLAFVCTEMCHVGQLIFDDFLTYYESKLCHADYMVIITLYSISKPRL